MLWDVNLYRVLIGFILLLTAIILAGIVWIISRRTIRGRYYRRLDLERDRYRSVIASITEGTFKGDLGSLRRTPQTIEWQAIEDLLLKLMESSSSEHQHKVTDVFERLSYVEFYLQKLKVGTSWERALAAQRLGAMRSTQAVPDLLKALEDNNYDVRQMVVVALGQIKDPQVLEVLVNKLKQTTDHKKGFSRRLLMAALIHYGASAVPFLVKKLFDPSDPVRALAAEILGEVPNRLALEIFIKSVEDPNPEVRAKIAYALARTGHALAVKPLVKLLSDQFWYVRLQAAKSLGRLGSPQAIFELSLRLTDSHAQVRLAAAEALVQIGPMALQALIPQLLYTTDRYAREQVAEVLQRSSLIHQWIEDLNAKDEMVRRQVEKLLVAIALGESINALIEALEHHPNSQVRIRLIDILEQTKKTMAFRAISRAALHDPVTEIREHARTVIRKATKNAKGRSDFGSICQQPRPL